MSAIEQSCAQSLQIDSLSEDNKLGVSHILPQDAHQSTQLQLTDSQSPEPPIPLQLPPLQPFESSFSQIDRDDTIIHFCESSHPSLLEQRPLYRRSHQQPPEGQDRWSTKETLPVVKPRQSRNFSRGRSEGSDSEAGYGYYPRGYRRGTRGKWREDGYYSRPFRNNYQYHNERERGDRPTRNNYSTFPNRYEDNRYQERNKYERNPYRHQHYEEQRHHPTNFNTSSHSHAQQQTIQAPQQQQSSNFLTNPVQTGWNAALWLQYLTMRENLKYLDMYYYQNYPQIAAQMLYTPPSLTPNGQMGFSPYATPPTQPGNDANFNQYAPPKQPQVLKKEQKTLPDAFSKICLPKFQIFVNKCCISVTCCKMDRLQADIILIPYHSPAFALFPGFTPQLYFHTKQRGQSLIQSQVLKSQTTNGKLTLLNTDLSKFRSLAFMKVCSPYEQNFTNCFNRGLNNLLSDSFGSTAVIPYSNDFGSSQEKAKRLVDILRAEQGRWERVVVNCQDVGSFKRMVEGFSRVVCQLDERGELDL